MTPVNLLCSHSDLNSSALWWSISLLWEISTASSPYRKLSSTATSTLLAQVWETFRWFRLRWSWAAPALSPDGDFSLPKGPADVGTWTTVCGAAAELAQPGVRQALNPRTQPRSPWKWALTGFATAKFIAAWTAGQSRERTLGKKPLAEYLDLPPPIISLQRAYCWGKQFFQKTKWK